MEIYIVLDLEWNQSPDGKEGETASLPFEIIEIGAVKLNHTFQEVSRFRCLIKPQVYKQLHYKTTEVIQMDMKEFLEEGVLFEKAMKDFLDWCGSDFVFCTWGSMDLTELQKNMAFYRMHIPFKKPLLYYDIQKLYSIFYGDGKKKQSLHTVVRQLKIEDGGVFHRALDDAAYTSRVMAHMDFEKVREYWSIDYYRLPQNKEEEVYLTFPNYSKYVSRGFDLKENAIVDKCVTDMLCYRCNRMLRKKVRWFSYHQKFYFGLAICPEHGFLKGKIRIKKGQQGQIHVIKTLKLVSEEEAEEIFEKKVEAKKKRVGKSSKK